MGYTSVRAEIVGVLSAHNAARDDRDRKLWNEMMEKIRVIVLDPKYRSIYADASLPIEPLVGWES